MPDNAKKGITVKVAAELHAEVSEYVRSHGMTMSEFVAKALDNELHPKISEKEGNNMANTRTVAFQVPEELFQRIKDYLNRNHMTQKQFLLGLIERELDREQSVRESENAVVEDEREQDEDEPEHSENSAVSDFEGVSDEDAENEESAGESEDEDSDEEFGDEDSEDEYADEDLDDEESEDEYADEDFDGEDSEDEYDDEDFDDEESEDDDYEMSM